MWLPSSVYFDPAFPPSLLVPLQGPLSRATPPTGSFKAPRVGSHRGGSRGHERQRVLFQVLPDSQGERRPPPHLRPASSEQVYQEAQVPHGMPGKHHSFPRSRRLVRCSRHEGRIFSFRDLPTAQEVSSFRSEPSSLPVCSSALRPLLGPSSFYQVYGSSSGLPPSSSHPCFSLPRRLADSRVFRGQGSRACTVHQRSVLSSRIDHQSREIHPTPNTGNRIHRSTAGLESSNSQLTSSTVQSDSFSRSGVPCLPHYHCPYRPRPPWSHGCVHLCHEAREATHAPSTTLARFSLSATKGCPGHGSHNTVSRAGLPQLVAGPRPSVRRSTVSSDSTLAIPDDGCFRSGMGRAPGPSADPRALVLTRAPTPHQCPGAKGGPLGMPGISRAATGPLCCHFHGQHDGHVLYKQTRRNTIFPPLPRGSETVGILHSPVDRLDSLFPPRGPEYSSGPTEQIVPDTRMVHPSGRPVFCLPEVGLSPDRPVRLQGQQEVSDVLLPTGPLPGLPLGRLSHSMDEGPPVCVSPVPVSPQGPAQTAQGQGQDDSDRSGMAEAVLVHHAARPVPGASNITTSLPGPYNTGLRQASSPRPPVPTPDGVAPVWLNESERQCSAEVQQVLLGSRKPSTRATYLAKWKRFSFWCARSSMVPTAVPVSVVLDYLLYLKGQGLALSSIRVHLAAISTFHPGESGTSTFSHPIVSRFLKGLERLYPPVKPPSPTWDLNLVLSRLMGPPFEPLATCSLLYLSWKTSFLVAITSARRVSELRALVVDPPYTIFHKDKVQLRPHPAFLPKVVSPFHLNQDIFLPVFFPKPHTCRRDQQLHTLDVRRALAFYISRTKAFRRSPQLFIAVAERMKGLPVTSQRISSWVTSCIRTCYELAHVPLGRITAHSTRAQASSAAFLAQVPIQDICRAATWSSVHTFTSHYALVDQSRDDAAFGSVVNWNQLEQTLF
nr:uncharacterized protein LOC116828359 [Chelonoidis abingdonii]